MRHPEGAPNDPSHRRSDHPVNQTDDGQRRKRTDVLRGDRRNDAGEHEARHGNVLSNFGQPPRAHIVHSGASTSHQYDLSTATCSLGGEEVGFGQHKPCADIQKPKGSDR